MPDSTSPTLHSHTLMELAEILVRHHNLHEGYFELALELQVGIGAIGDENDRLPGAMIRFKSIGLRKISQMATLAVDAAKVNPGPQSTGVRGKGKRAKAG